MRTPGEILVQTAFRLYQDNTDALKEHLSKRIDAMLEKRLSTVGDTDMETITLYVCDVCEAPPTAIRTKSRMREAVEARAILYKIFTSKQMFGWSQKRTGLFFGGRDHSTVIHGMENYDTWFDTDKVFRRKAEVCMEFAIKVISGLHENQGDTN